ncbi:MAG: hypothetical protein C0598_12100 [Marinilabiliales bacterium]|nr:MAG: hypothetical protein C0598_12100 [Marinilabiliales bacterium]
MLIALVVFNYTNVSAQELSALRLEVPADIDIESYHVETLGQKGVIIFYESNELTNDKKRKWYFGFFDSSLNQKWLKFLILEDKLRFVSSYKTGSKLHLLFRNIGSGRNESGYYEIVSFNANKDAFEQISGTFPARAEIMGFEIIGNTACLGININYEDTDLLFVNLTSGDIEPVKLAESYTSYIETVFANQVDNKFYIALKVKQDNRYIKDLIHKVSPKGKTIEVREVLLDDNTKLLRKFRFCNLNNELAIFGLYDLYKGKLNDFSKMEDEDNPKTAGLFYINYSGENDLSAKFIDFLKLDNINGSITNRKALMRKSANEDITSAFFNISKPEVMASNDNYIFSAEIYKPHYITETRMDYDFYGRPYPYSYSVFAGYLFYDVIIISFDKEGNVKWNNDFILRDLKSFSLKRHSIIIDDGKYVTAAYVNNGNIYTNTYDRNIDIANDEAEIASSNEKDRVVQDENNYIKNWYDNNYIIYGYQKINNRSLAKKDERTVFYLNKVVFK